MGTALCGVLGTAVAVPFGAFAQEDDRGGMRFQLRLGERLRFRDRKSPEPAEDGTHSSLTTDVGVAFSSETRTEAVRLDFGTGYSLVDGPTTDGYEGRFSDPTLSLSYSQDTAASRLSVTATASSVHLSDVSALDVPTAEDEIVPVDFAALTDVGTRQQLGFDARLSLRRDAPFGLILGVGANAISYADLPAGSSLRDRTGLQLTATGRFDVTKVLQVRAGLQYDHIDKDGAENVDRLGVKAQAVLSRPDGNYRVWGNIADGDGGGQVALSMGRRYELPDTVADIAFGVTRATTEEFVLTGSALYERGFGPESALGTLSAKADRDLSFASGSDEELVTSLSLASGYALTPLANLQVSAKVGQAENLATGGTVDLAQAGVSVRYDFDRNWQASAGISAEMRDASDEAPSESTTLSLGITRSFDLRR